MKLSFCMPTYNYGRYIRTAIESVRSQAEEGVEVIVLDGGSTDDTGNIVQAIAASWPAVRYVLQETRGGIDADLARSIELATGEYCWLLSADDALEPGAVRRILEEFEAGSDMLLCNRVWCDSELKPLGAQLWLDDAADRRVDLARDDELHRYLNDAQSLGALFSFMSCIGFRREAWARAGQGAPAIDCYAHAGRLFAMGRRGARFKYIAAPLVLCRGGTDSFRAEGLARRLLFDLRGYLQLARAVLPGSDDLRGAFLRVLKREHPWWRWIRVRGGTKDPVMWRDVEQHLAIYGYNGAEMLLINVFGAAFGVLRMIVAFVRRLVTS